MPTRPSKTAGPPRRANAPRGGAAPSLGAEIAKKKPFDQPEAEATLNILRTASVLAGDFDQLFKEHGLSEPLYNVLRILRGEGTRLPSQSIGPRLITRVPDVTRLVDRLEEAGLVVRERCPDDRRIVYVRITSAGLKKLAALDDPVRELHKAQLGHMSRADLARLSKLLAKARAAST